ncbi:hypothetical protein [Streptacidiphilus monticola]|uniref:Uncharacterized protein n=1 Tax=Streptacidiphilus monticola TaxID=2161674 RepID=A0ABW1GAJ8_9ACTN
MDIKWAALASTFGVSLAISLAVVAVFSLGIVALGRKGGAAAVHATWTATAYLCFAACAAAVGYGLYLIAHK